MKHGAAFEFSPPVGWKEFPDGNRLVFQGGGDEELIVSTAVVGGAGCDASLARIREQLVANAIQSMRQAIDDPALVAQELKESTTANGLRSWTIEAATVDGSVLFLQAAIEGDIGVMLTTLEAPNRQTVRGTFQNFLDGVRPTVRWRNGG